MRGRKPKEESRAEELREKLVAWRAMPWEIVPESEASTGVVTTRRISLRMLATRLGTSEQLLSHYLKTQDEWEARRRGEMCQASGDVRSAVYWFVQAATGKHVRKMERKFRKTRTLGEGDISVLKTFAKAGEPKAQELLAKVGSVQNSEDNLSSPSRASPKSLDRIRGGWLLR